MYAITRSAVLLEGEKSKQFHYDIPVYYFATNYGMEAEKLPELVVSAIKSACASGKKLSWKIQESDRGMLVQLVWKPARISRAMSLSTVKVVSNWSNQKRKSPSRLRRDA